MRVIGRTKPKGAMKVKGACLFGGACRGRSLTGRCRRVHAIPKRGPVAVQGRSESLSSVRRRSRGWRGALVGPSLLACTQGGAGPGLVIRRCRANLLLTSSALLGLSAGVPRVWAGFGRGPLSGGFFSGSSGAVAPSDPALSGVA